MFGIKDYLTPQFEVREKKAEVVVGRKNNIDIKVQVSGCDFLVTKKTAQTKKTLACIVSQGLYFVRDEKTNVDTPLTADLLKSFIGQTETIPLVDNETGEECCWLESLSKGKTACDSVFAILESENIRPYLKYGYVYFCEEIIQRERGVHVLSLEFSECRFKYVSSVFRKLNPEEKRKYASYMAGYLTNVGGRVSCNILSLLFDDDVYKYFSTNDGWGISGTTEFLLEAIRNDINIVSYQFENIVFSQHVR